MGDGSGRGEVSSAQSVPCVSAAGFCCPMALLGWSAAAGDVRVFGADEAFGSGRNSDTRISFVAPEGKGTCYCDGSRR